MPTIAGAALLCAAVTWRIGTSLLLPPALALTILGCLLATVDQTLHRLPHALTLPGTLLIVALLIPAAVRDPQSGLRALEAAAVSIAFYMVVAFTGAGAGDMKASAATGLVTGWIGWSALLAATVLSFLLMFTVAVTVLATRRARRGDRIAAGIHVYGGALLAVLLLGPGA
ncbi:prepilin peptidase [Kitasatospora xanthocidica]|uniref:prepilin peptidase n=1 Tax=Kitasatospora xanthocidica TaxID=83382 RepID=UPI0036E430B6